MSTGKFPLQIRMVKEWGLVIDGVFLPWQMLEDLRAQHRYDSDGGDAFISDTPEQERVLLAHNLAVKETRGGLHSSGTDLADLMASYTDDDWVESAEQKLREALLELHRKAGAPSSRNIATGVTSAGHKVCHTTVNNALTFTHFPTWPVMRDIVLFLDGDLIRFQDLWKAARGEKSARG
jgi:hypothetical protein